MPFVLGVSEYTQGNLRGLPQQRDCGVSLRGRWIHSQLVPMPQEDTSLLAEPYHPLQGTNEEWITLLRNIGATVHTVVWIPALWGSQQQCRNIFQRNRLRENSVFQVSKQLGRDTLLVCQLDCGGGAHLQLTIWCLIHHPLSDRFSARAVPQQLREDSSVWCSVVAMVVLYCLHRCVFGIHSHFGLHRWRCNQIHAICTGRRNVNYFGFLYGGWTYYGCWHQGQGLEG